MKRKAFSEHQSEAAVAALVRRARVTSNPLYYWQAIRLCEGLGVPLPPECLQYIHEVARDMIILMMDVRADPPRCAPDAAARLAAERMELAGQGKNAFRKLRTDDVAVKMFFAKYWDDKNPHVPAWSDLLREPGRARTVRRLATRGGELLGPAPPDVAERKESGADRKLRVAKPKVMGAKGARTVKTSREVSSST